MHRNLSDRRPDNSDLDTRAERWPKTRSYRITETAKRFQKDPVPHRDERFTGFGEGGCLFVRHHCGFRSRSCGLLRTFLVTRFDWSFCSSHLRTTMDVFSTQTAYKIVLRCCCRHCYIGGRKIRLLFLPSTPRRGVKQKYFMVLSFFLLLH